MLDAETGLVSRTLGQQTGIDRLVDITALLRNLGAIVLAFVGLTVLLIVINGIRMALMSRAQEIEVMRLVGASDAYVRWPFILEGLFIGLGGALITLLLLLPASAPISDLARQIAGEVPLGFDRCADRADRQRRARGRARPRRCRRLDQRAGLPAALRRAEPSR